MIRRRASFQQPIKAVIEDWLNAHPAARKAKETRIIHLWGDLLGPMIKNHTTYISFYGGKLTVGLDSAVLRNELSLARGQIMKELNAAVGSELVTEIILR